MAEKSTKKAVAPVTPEQAAELAQEAFREGYGHLFSVVIAAHNAEEYVGQSLKSVANQSIGFEHTQVVVVDDGSTDGTAAACRSFAERHPGNVVVINQENRGASAARNAGLEVVDGKYVNFLDSDDKWSSDAFSYALEFFQAHPDVHIAAARYVYFGARTGNHRLNYKFKETRVIDLIAERDCPQLSASTCFFRADVLEGRWFCDELSVSEDTRFVNEILIDELRYGVMAGPTYRYRQHDDGTSAIATMKQNRSWYLDTPRLCYEHLMEVSRLKHGCVLPFVQHTVMYDLQWRLRAKAPDNLASEELAAYRATLVSLLGEIDDEIVSEQRTISVDYVAYAFALKYGVTLQEVVSGSKIENDWVTTQFEDGEGVTRSLRLRPLDALSDGLTVERVAAGGDGVLVEGFLTSYRFRPEDVQISVTANNRLVDVQIFATDEHKLMNAFGDDSPGKTGFRLRLPLVRGGEACLRAEVTLFGRASRRLSFRFQKGSGLPEKTREGAYSFINECLVRVVQPDKASIRLLPKCGYEKKIQVGKSKRVNEVDYVKEYSRLAENIPRAKRIKNTWNYSHL